MYKARSSAPYPEPPGDVQGSGQSSSHPVYRPLPGRSLYQAPYPQTHTVWSYRGAASATERTAGHAHPPESTSKPFSFIIRSFLVQCWKVSRVILLCSYTCSTQRKRARGRRTSGSTCPMRSDVTGWCLSGRPRTTWSRTWWLISTARTFFTPPLRIFSPNRSLRSESRIKMISLLIFCFASIIIIISLFYYFSSISNNIQYDLKAWIIFFPSFFFVGDWILKHKKLQKILDFANENNFHINIFIFSF